MLKVENLCKKYPTFCLDNVTFHVPAGVIVGFIGQNGAGKTTTLKCIMQSVLPDSGTICVNNKSMATHEEENKQIISFTTGAFDYYRNHTLQKIANVYKTFYHDWDDELFKKYCLKFKLDTFKRVKELSAGMRVKFALALALSHNAQLFLFDEPTSGLDPIARDEMLDVFQDIVLDGDKSILFSTHITSDLEKCADYIIYIDNGKILLACPKDELLDSHAIIKGSLDNLTEDICQRCVAVKTNKFGYTGLIKRSYLLPTDSFVTERPTVEDIMIYYNKGGSTMIKLFKKELALNVHKPLYLFWLLGAMILIPNYPVIVGAGYTIMQIFVYLQTSSSYLSQEFSSTLPVKRSDIVSSNTLVIAMFQVVNVAISLLLMPVAQLLYPSGNLAGMDANFTFIGVALICLAGFNSLFIPNYFKTGYKFGKPVVLGLVAFVVIYGACETLLQTSPTLKAIFEGYESTTIVWRIVIMVVGIAIYVIATIFANKRAVKNFEKVNL